MTNTTHAPHTTPRPSSRPRNRIVTRAVPVTEARVQPAELRELLESHLSALQALLEEQRRTLEKSMRAVVHARPFAAGMSDPVSRAERAALLGEVRALGDHRAPWVKALEETRALLYVALQEVVAGEADAGRTMKFSPPVLLELLEQGERA